MRKAETAAYATRTLRCMLAACVPMLAAAAPAANTAAGSAATRYTLDAAHSTLEYQFVQAGARNKGLFHKFAVTLSFSPSALPQSRLEVVVETASLDTGDQDRDDTMRSADLLDVAQYPQARFSATSITRTAAGYDAAGKLTIRGVTRVAHVPFTFRSSEQQGRSVGYLAGKLLLHRLDFGIGQGEWKSTDGVGNDVTVSYALQLLPAR